MALDHKDLVVWRELVVDQDRKAHRVSREPREPWVHRVFQGSKASQELREHLELWVLQATLDHRAQLELAGY